MKILILYLLVWSNFLFAKSSFNIENFVQQLKESYAVEVKNLTFQEASNCIDIKDTDNCIFYLKYRNITDEEDYIYTLSLVFAIVDKKTKTITKNYFHENIADSDAISIEEIEFDTTFYQKGILNLYISYYGSSRSNPYSSTELFMYEIKKNGFSPLLEHFESHLSFSENNRWNGHGSIHNYEIKNKKNLALKKPIEFTHKYIYTEFSSEGSIKENDWNVTLEPIILAYKNGKYVIMDNKKSIFDLEEIESNSKKGLRYKSIVLKAMLWEEPLMKSNIEHYNNIAYYLQQAKHYKESVVVLKEITDTFPKRVVAHYNLGDSYWELNKRTKAINSYQTYIKMMNTLGKKNKIPKKVLERVPKIQTFEDGFIEVHKNIEDISPLLLQDKNVAKPIAVLPWLQKTLINTKHGDGKIIKVVAYENNGKMEFVYFFMSSAKNEVGVLKLYGINQYTKSSFLIDKISTTNSAKSIHNKNFSAWLNNDFLVEDGYIYFENKYDRFDEDTKHNIYYYAYRYKLGEEGLFEDAHYEISYNSLEFYNHKKTIRAMADNGVLELIYADNKRKNEFITNSDKFIIGSVNWSLDDKFIYFDNHGADLSCILRYNIESKELSKIVPEHEAEHPFSYNYKEKEYIVYIEGSKIKIATPNIVELKKTIDKKILLN